MRFNPVAVRRCNVVLFFHPDPAALIIGAFVIEAGELIIALPSALVGQLEGLQLTVAVWAEGVLRGVSPILWVDIKRAPGAAAPGAENAA